MADEAKPAPAPDEAKPADGDGAAASEAPAKPSAGGKPTIAIKIYAPFKVYFEGEGSSISAINATGPFDILPHHHNFLCMLLPCDIVVKTPQGSTEIVKITRALMHVKEDNVTVFVDV